MADPEHLRDLFGRLGHITVRRMFGGAGIYADGVMFALEADDLLYLKADAGTAAAFDAAGCAPFVYTGKPGAKPITMSYRRMPDTALDDPDEAERWGGLALAAALRAAALRRPSALRPGRGSSPGRPR